MSYNHATVFRSVALALALTLSVFGQQTEDQVRKIFAENCLVCHGATRTSGLSLSTRGSILTGGKRGPAVIPGKSSDSLLYNAVAHKGDLQMPPGGKTLSAEQVRVIRDWIDAGAPFAGQGAAAEPTWWSFKRPIRPAARSIDELVLTKTPQADRRTLIRRASFDLTGLPPTPEEVAAFVKDPDPEAYPRLDRSPSRLAALWRKVGTSLA